MSDEDKSRPGGSGADGAAIDGDAGGLDAGASDDLQHEELTQTAGELSTGVDLAGNSPAFEEAAEASLLLASGADEEASPAAEERGEQMALVMESVPVAGQVLDTWGEITASSVGVADEKGRIPVTLSDGRAVHFFPAKAAGAGGGVFRVQGRYVKGLKPPAEAGSAPRLSTERAISVNMARYERARGLVREELLLVARELLREGKLPNRKLAKDGEGAYVQLVGAVVKEAMGKSGLIDEKRKLLQFVGVLADIVASDGGMGGNGALGDVLGSISIEQVIIIARAADVEAKGRGLNVANVIEAEFSGA